MNRTLGLVVAAYVLAALGLHADRVVLRNGQHLEGAAEQQPNGDVVVRWSAGSMTVPAHLVERVERGETLEQRVQQFLARRPEAAADELWQWALECRRAGAATLARRLAERVIAKDGDHEAARRALGYRLFEGHWLTESELHELRGDVLFRGEWVSARDKAELLDQEALAQIALLDLRLQHQRELRAEAERARARQERADSAHGIPFPYVWWPLGSPGLPGPPPAPPHRPPELAPPQRSLPPAEPRVRRPLSGSPGNTTGMAAGSGR